MGSQNYIMPFGKHKGKDLLHIMEFHPNYLEWLITLDNLKEPLKTHVEYLSKTKYFQDSLFEYRENEMAYLDGLSESDIY